MAYILCLETSGPEGSVALSKDGVAIAEVTNGDRFSHAQTLMLAVDSVLKKADIDKDKLDAICLSAGPGSYTGLRIGTSAAKGLCYAIDIPLIAISSLHILAATFQLNHPDNKNEILAAFDARRDEVYFAIFDHKLQRLYDDQSEIISPDFLSTNTADIALVGSGAEKIERLSNLQIVPNNNYYPLAKSAAALAEAKFNQQLFEETHHFNPVYLKPFLTNQRK